MVGVSHGRRAVAASEYREAAIRLLTDHAQEMHNSMMIKEIGSVGTFTVPT